MSFGCSPSDIYTLVRLTVEAYRGWNRACGEYSEITGSLESLRIVLERIQNEASKPGSALSRATKDKADLKRILSSTEPIVRELHTIIVKFKDLSSSRAKTWTRLRFGVKNLDSLRTRLAQHITAITTCLDAVGLGSLGRIERELGSIPDRFQHIINGLAAEIRAGRREGTIMTTYSDDETDVWKQFRGELIQDGIKSKVLHKYKPLIVRHLKEFVERGELEELCPNDASVTDGTLSNSDLSNATPILRSYIQEQTIEREDPSAFEKVHIEDATRLVATAADLPEYKLFGPVKTNNRGESLQTMDYGWCSYPSPGSLSSIPNEVEADGTSARNFHSRKQTALGSGHAQWLDTSQCDNDPCRLPMEGAGSHDQPVGCRRSKKLEALEDSDESENEFNTTHRQELSDEDLKRARAESFAPREPWGDEYDRARRTTEQYDRARREMNNEVNRARRTTPSPDYYFEQVEGVFYPRRREGSWSALEEFSAVRSLEP